MLSKIGNYKDTPEFKKSVGLYIKNNNPEHGSAFFPFLNGKGIDSYVKKKIRPTGNML